MTFKTFLVGGAVRDGLLGRAVKDRDFVAVGATEQDMFDLGYTSVGADFPVFLDDSGNEVALARQERKVSAGYTGFVTTATPDVTLEEDLVRRDLTINAMARDPDTDELIDPHGGVDDLRAGVLRHVSPAFAEDPLRVLRVARFAARYDFKVAPETMDLMSQLVQSGELDHLTPERVWAELERAVMEDHPSKFFWTLDSCGAKDVLFPEMERTLITSGFFLTKAALRNADYLTRMMLLFSHMEWKKSNKMLVRLKAPSEVQKFVRKFREVFCALQGDHGSWSMTPRRLLNLFSKIDAFRQPVDVYAISNAVVYVGGSTGRSERMDTLLTAFKDVCKVTFATLPEKKQATLQGADIGKAIDKARVARLKKIL